MDCTRSSNKRVKTFHESQCNNNNNNNNNNHSISFASSSSSSLSSSSSTLDFSYRQLQWTVHSILDSLQTPEVIIDIIYSYVPKFFTYISSFGKKGTKNDEFIDPTDLFVDSTTHQLYVCDSNNHRIQVFDQTTHSYIRTIGKQDLNANELRFPHGIFIDEFYLYVSEFGNHRVQIFDKKTGTSVRTIGSYGNGMDQFSYCCGITGDMNYLCVCDKGNSRIQIIDKHTHEFVGSICNNHDLNSPRYIAMDHQFIYVTDYYHVAIFEKNHSSNYKFVTALGSEDSECTNKDGQFKHPYGIALDSTSSFLYIGDYGNKRIQVFRKLVHHHEDEKEEQDDDKDNNRGFALSYAFSYKYAIEGCTSLTMDTKTNTLYVCDAKNHRIQLLQ